MLGMAILRTLNLLRWSMARRRRCSYGRYHRDRSWHRHHSVDVCVCSAVRAHLMLDVMVGGAVSALMLVYLVWALVRPEDF
jgi:K+-transporting ATPase KdpF subunit